MSTLDLGIIGNGTIAAFVDASAEITWACMPRLDGDPAFCSLLRPRAAREPGPGDFGWFGIELEGEVGRDQAYVPNTAVLRTRLYDATGAAIEVIDAAPRFERYGRVFCPMMIVRQVRALRGLPRVRLRVRPAARWGRRRRGITFGSHHVRYVDADPVLRLTTDAPITAVLEEMPFVLDRTITLVLGPDETLPGAPHAIGREFIEETEAWWRRWVAGLTIPFEWQDAVIRAAIALQLNAFEDTGAIVAALTTSIPESADSGRNWDYRYCWLRDAAMVVHVLNRLGATRTLERYLQYLVNVIAGSPDGRLQPVYDVLGGARLDERIVDALPGFRGMGPVRVGNAAYAQQQHDSYGAAILAAAHLFFDHRLERRGTLPLFDRLATLGMHAAEQYARPDAGLWEFRGRPNVHTHSAVMCWAGCDRLARIAAHLGLRTATERWRRVADTMHAEICARAWNGRLGTFVSAFDGDGVDASLLLLHELGFLAADDPRFAPTVRTVEDRLMRGDLVFRYVHDDDFGAPKNAFVVCSFWHANALAALGRKDEARERYVALLDRRNALGHFAEHLDPATGEQWGNYVQTYSMVGVINGAIRLSRHWDQAF